MQNFIELHVVSYTQAKDGGIDLQCEGIDSRNQWDYLFEDNAHFKPGEFELDEMENFVRFDATAYKNEMSRLKRVNNRIAKQEMAKPFKRVEVMTYLED